jgi:tetratricopeptide (TPR) repeat protein
MFKLLLIGLVLFVNTYGNPAFATDILSLPPVESLKVKSKYFNSPIEYNITLPESYNKEKGKDKKYFIIFDLHPRSQAYLSGIHDWLSHNGGWPWLESIVVTPANYNPEFAKVFEQVVSDPKNITMLNYFESDLLTAIDKNYRTNGFRVFSGFMGNSALGLYTLLNRPNLFNAFILSSPSLADDFGKITSEANAKLAKLDDKMRFLYLSTGNHRYEQGNLPSLDLFEKALQQSAPKSLDWQVHRNNKNNYMSQPIISVINGIEALFNDIHTDLQPDSSISNNGVNAIIDYYARISKNKYGFDVSAEGSLKSLAKSLEANNPEKALSIYKKVVSLYPNSAYALSSLAKAYADRGEINKAIKYQTTAVEKSKSMVTWHQRKHKQYLEEFKNTHNQQQ